MMAAVAAVFGTMSCRKDNVPSMNQGNGNVPVDGERTALNSAITGIASWAILIALVITIVLAIKKIWNKEISE